MAFVIRIDGLADGSQSSVDGEYLVAFIAQRSPTGAAVTTPRAESAMRFADRAAALAYYQQVPSPPHDRRPDGKPNRPLTAYAITLVEDGGSAGSH